MNKDYMFGKTSYLPKIQYNQLISNQNNQNRVNYLELSLNNRNTLSPYYNLNNNNSSIARNSNSFRNTFSSSKIGHYYPLSSNNLNNDYNNFTPKRLERRNQSSNQENLNSNQFYHLVKTNPKLLKNNNQNHNQISSFTSSSPKKNVSNSTKSKTFS